MLLVWVKLHGSRHLPDIGNDGEAKLLIWVDLHGSRRLSWHTQQWEKPCYWYGSNCMGLDVFPGIHNDGRSHDTGMG